MFAYRSRRKREFETINSRETLSYSLQYDDEFYSVKRSKSALKKSNSSSNSSRKSVQFNEVVLEVFDLINDDECDNTISNRLSSPKIVKSSLKNEKVYVPVRYSNTIFPKTIINEYNVEIINFQRDEEKEGKQENKIEDTKNNSNENQLSEILIIKENEDETSSVLSHTKDTDSEVTLTNTSTSSQKTNVAETVITSEANSVSNLINSNNASQKSNTIPRRSRPSYKGHRRQSSVRLKCIY